MTTVRDELGETIRDHLGNALVAAELLLEEPESAQICAETIVRRLRAALALHTQSTRGIS